MDEKVSFSIRLWPAAKVIGGDVETSEPSLPMLVPRAEMTSGVGVVGVANLLTCAKMAGMSVELLETFSKLSTE